MTTILDLEEQDIELQLQEIQLKRRMVEIERKKLKESKTHKVKEPKVNLGTAIGNLGAVISNTMGAMTYSPTPAEQLHLHYSKSAKESVMKIAGVTPEGCILVAHGSNSSNISKKYNVRSMKGIRDNLPKWSKRQKTQSHFWTNIAAKYSRKFFDNDSISRTTIEKLCYLVDSGMMDKWFDEYDHLKNQGAQSQLQLEEC